MCIGVKLQGLHRAPPSNLTGALTSHCVVRGGGGTCKEWNGTREGMYDHSWLFTSLVRSLEKLSIVNAETRARPVISHVGVTNVARQR